MSGMGGKKSGTKFTILLRGNDTRHLQASEILNGLGFHGKAQYIVNAFLHYASYEGKPDTPNAIRLDYKYIEAVVNRLLSERNGAGAICTTPVENRPENTLLSAEEINFDDALEALGGDGFSAIADALEMFKQT